MGIFNRIFGGPKLVGRDVAALSAPLAIPAIRITLSPNASRSHFGGTPLLPAAFAWPTYDNKPLDFLARLQLEELQSALEIEWLPRTGALLFFYDMDSQPWGYEPNERDGWRICHLQDLTDEQTRDNPAATVLSHHFLEFRPMASLPSTERAQVEALKLSDEEGDRYCELMQGAEPAHQCGGYPVPIQGDSMELDCQLASNGLYCGDSSGYNDPRAAELKAGIPDWKLLLQIDTDETMDLMWGDCGTLYFWVQQAAARRSDFSNGWVTLQCS